MLTKVDLRGRTSTFEQHQLMGRKDFPETNFAWAEVEKQHLHINQVDFRGCVTFSDIAQHYAEHELGERTESIDPKAHTTIRAYERVLRNRLLPRWGNRVALSLEPLEIERRYRASLDNRKRAMFAISSRDPR